ncbi:MAG: cell division protein FtsX [Hahellaceae bacterium]|nr:cell division protein FtsX [Hahellaceae bacterium]MCP5169296.1 cell division protein FtsX [Hahellaceae bacterium]
MREHGAQKSRQTNEVQSYLSHHRKVAQESIQRLRQSPLITLMTWAVIGIALSLPTGFTVILSNFDQLGANWESSAQVSLFLKHEISEADARALAQTLKRHPMVADVAVITREQALADLKKQSDLGDVLGYLDSNPLPHVVVLTPTPASANSRSMASLRQSLENLNEVDRVQLDMLWVERLFAMISVIERGAWTLSLLFGLAVLLVIGNTTRLAIENRREEIVVVKLVGGTNAFVRRPFLYTGLWYGLGGGLVAALLVTVTLFWLSGPIDVLAQSYESGFRLSGLTFGSTLLLLSVSMLLGWLGAWLAVRRHLDAIEPT